MSAAPVPSIVCRGSCGPTGSTPPSPSRCPAPTPGVAGHSAGRAPPSSDGLSPHGETKVLHIAWHPSATAHSSHLQMDLGDNRNELLGGGGAACCKSDVNGPLLCSFPPEFLCHGGIAKDCKGCPDPMQIQVTPRCNSVWFLSLSMPSVVLKHGYRNN